MPERWFSDEELDEMTRPTMDVAIDAIDSGDPKTAKELCQREKHESQFMHDMLVDGMAGLISFVTYDKRLLDAASAAGLPVDSPT